MLNYQRVNINVGPCFQTPNQLVNIKCVAGFAPMFRTYPALSMDLFKGNSKSETTTGFRFQLSQLNQSIRAGDGMAQRRTRMILISLEVLKKSPKRRTRRWEGTEMCSKLGLSRETNNTRHNNWGNSPNHGKLGVCLNIYGKTMDNPMPSTGFVRTFPIQVAIWGYEPFLDTPILSLAHLTGIGGHNLVQVEEAPDDGKKKKKGLLDNWGKLPIYKL